MNQKKLSKNKNYSGFSFLETIFAVFLISIGMIAVMALMASSLRESMDSRDQVVAALLSQEGIELIRSIRDNNWVSEQDSFTGFPLASKLNCQIDSISNSIYCGFSISSDLKINSDGIYNHTSGTDTKFKRKIRVKYIGTEKDVVEITSAVNWGGKDFPAWFTLENQCTSLNKCAYTKTVLGRWGGE